MAELKRTRDYSMFELHPCNRPYHNDAELERSMREKGFMPSSPIQVIKNGNGKLKIIRGHHRFSTAKRLGLPVYYVLDDSNTDIFKLEGTCKQRWTALDFVHARASSGDADCRALKSFADAHGIAVGTAARLLSGSSDTSGHSANPLRRVRAGDFIITGSDHAEEVVRITDHCHACGVTFARSHWFVGAVSLMVRVPHFDHDWFMAQVKKWPDFMHKRTCVDAYLDEIESMYNYNLGKGRKGGMSARPLAFDAKKEAAERNKAVARGVRSSATFAAKAARR